MTTTDNQRNQLRAMTRGAYDLQSLRIQSGLRLCANFRAKLGQTAGMTEEEMDEDAKKVIDVLRDNFKLLTAGIAKNRTLPAKEGFTGNDIISDYSELALISQYLALETVERQQFSQLEKILVDFPIYMEFLLGVRGIGPAMAAVIISEFDIHRARYPSSMWKYAGLDVVTHWELTNSTWVRRKIGGGAEQPTIAYEPSVPVLLDNADGGNGPVFNDDDGTTRTVSYYHDPETRAQIGTLAIEKDGWLLQLEYKQINDGGRSRKKIHLVKREYVNKDGVVAERDSITYNPWLKTKLMGVVASSFLRSNRKDDDGMSASYAEFYYSYKHRLETDPARIKSLPKPPKGTPVEEVDPDAPKPDLWSKGRIHQAAMRYMVKMFLCDLYNAWRPLEGLSVEPTYHDKKLGHKHGEAGRSTAAA